MASGSKSSTLPSKMPHSGNFASSNKGFLGKIRQKLGFGHRRQYSFEEKDGVVLTGVYSRRASEESSVDRYKQRDLIYEPFQLKSRVPASEESGDPYEPVQLNSHVPVRPRRKHEIDRTLSSKSDVSDTVLRRNRTENLYADLTQEERRKSLIVDRESGLFTKALNSTNLKNDLLVPDDSAIDLDKLADDFDLHSMPQSLAHNVHSPELECIDDIDPDYETLEDVRQRIAARIKDSDNHRLKNESRKDMATTLENADHNGSSLICSSVSNQNITRDSGLGSPGAEEEGSTNLSTEGFVCYPDEKSLLTGNGTAPEILLTENKSSSLLSECMENSTKWNCDQTKDIYDNPQVLFRKRSQKVSPSQNCNSVQMPEIYDSSSSSNMFIENVSGCAIDNDVMESSVFIRQDISVDMEGPPLPARNYSVYIDEENNKFNDLIKSGVHNTNAIHISYSDNNRHIVQRSKEKEPPEGQRERTSENEKLNNLDSKTLPNGELITLANKISNCEHLTIDTKKNEHSVITMIDCKCSINENEFHPKHTCENRTSQSDSILPNHASSMPVIDLEPDINIESSTDLLHESSDSGFCSCMYQPSLTSSKQSCDDTCCDSKVMEASMGAELPDGISVAKNVQGTDSQHISKEFEDSHAASKEMCNTYSKVENSCEEKCFPASSENSFEDSEKISEHCEQVRNKPVSSSSGIINTNSFENDQTVAQLDDSLMEAGTGIGDYNEVESPSSTPLTAMVSTASPIQEGKIGDTCVSKNISQDRHLTTGNDSCFNSKEATEGDECCVQTGESDEHGQSACENPSVNIETETETETYRSKQSSTDTDHMMKSTNISSFMRKKNEKDEIDKSSRAAARRTCTQDLVILKREASSYSSDDKPELSVVIVPQEEDDIHMCLGDIDWDRIRSFRELEDISQRDASEECQTTNASPPVIPPRRPRKKEKVEGEFLFTDRCIISYARKEGYSKFSLN